jgi:hypothetical protein
MMHKNELEARLFKLNYDLSIAKLNNWEFDIACLEDEIAEVIELLQTEFDWEYED